MNQEGVIKFNLKFKEAPPLSLSQIWELNAWRTVLFLNNLIGQDPKRYEGYGYGNISARRSPHQNQSFIVTGTQTGERSYLSGKDYTVVLECSPEKKLLVAEGPVKPSSEALTHGMVYQLNPDARAVIHVHSPLIWRKAERLGIPLTDKSAPYGSPEMAKEVKRLFEKNLVQEKKIFAMGGHEDGVVAFGRSLSEAGNIILNYLFKAG